MQDMLSWSAIFGQMAIQFTPTLLALIVTFVLSFLLKDRLGLYGKLFDSTIGMIGLGLVLFWAFTAFFAGVFDWIATHDALEQSAFMKRKPPGTAYVDLLGPAKPDVGTHYLLGGDNLGRDVFSRMIEGSIKVILIAPFATVFAFMAGITLGLPAGYYGGQLDTVLSFLSNLVIAFPVILLFYLLVTPEIVQSGLSVYIASVLFLFPIIFFVILLNSRFHIQPKRRNFYVAITLVLGSWFYIGIAWDADPFGIVVFPPNLLIVFVSVVLVNTPTVFRIVRGLTLDIKTRDYIAAAQTRGEGPWYIMLWEILPNARGPLLVDFCLRVGYTTILLGTLGFFGLGLESESADWGKMIIDGRKLLAANVLHIVLPPALALLSLVLGLNFLADGLREESLKQ
ncbi:MAG: ABC transporter permease [Pseudomonadota bacterium]